MKDEWEDEWEELLDDESVRTVLDALNLLPSPASEQHQSNSGAAAEQQQSNGSSGAAAAVRAPLTVVVCSVQCLSVLEDVDEAAFLLAKIEGESNSHPLDPRSRSPRWNLSWSMPLCFFPCVSRSSSASERPTGPVPS